VAIIASIGRANTQAEVGPRDAKTVIAPAIDDHQILRAHVAINTSDFGIVEVMRWSVERFALVAACTEIVVAGQNLGRVGVVAVGAGHAGGVHFRLLERSVDIDLVLILAIGVIQPFVQ